MKRTKFLILALVVAIMMLGAGYAAWTDTLTITSTVETGTLDFELGDTAQINVYRNGNGDPEDPAVVPREASYNRIDENTATVTITNLYPGARAVVTIPYTNLSTIPVKVDNLNVISKSADYYNVTASYLGYDGGLVPAGQSGNIVLTIDVLDSAEQDDTATITFEVTYEQFNQQ